MTFELVDLEELGEKALSDFSQAVERDDSKSAGRLGEAARDLVAKVEFTYAVAAKLAHREQTVEGTAAIWTKVVAICDQIAVEVSELEKTADLDDSASNRILNFRNAAERRRELHS